MVSNKVHRSSVGIKFSLGDLTDDASVEHVHELFHVLGVNGVFYLALLLVDLTSLGFLGVVDQDTRILLEGIFSLKMPGELVEGDMLFKNIIFLLLISRQDCSITATDTAFSHPELAVCTPFHRRDT